LLYKAVVIDNSMLFTRGTIWDLEERFPEVLTEGDLPEEAGSSQFSNDFEATLMSSFGGGRNYGSLVIPQINEKGIVSFLGGSKTNPIWMGGLFEVTRGENFDIEFVNFPSDKFEDGTHVDGITQGEETNFGDEIEPPEEKSFIFRTKHTKSDSAEEINFRNQETSNIISLGKRRVRLTHFPEGSWVEDEEAENDNEDDEEFQLRKPFKYKDFLMGLNEDGEQTFRYEDKIVPTPEEADEGQGDITSRLEINQEKIELVKENINEETPSYSKMFIDDTTSEIKNYKIVDDMEYSSAVSLKDGLGEISIIQEDVRTHWIGFNEEDITIEKKNIDEDKITTITMGEESLSLKVIGDDEVTIGVDGTDVTIKTPDVTFSISGSDVTVTAANFHFDGDAFKIAGGGDNVSLYTPLETILNELLTHVHTAPSGPTTPAEKSDKTPLVSLKPDVMKIKSQTSTTD